MNLRKLFTFQIPLPGPVVMIDVANGTGRQKRATVAALRFLLQAVPALAVECLMIFAGHSPRPWYPLAAALATAGICVLLIGVRPAGEDGP